MPTAVARLPDHTSLFVNNIAEFSKEFDRENNRHKVYRREDYVVTPPALENVSDGERRFREFYYYVQNAFWKPEVFQQQFIEYALQVMAELIVGPKDWPTVGPRLIEEFGNLHLKSFNHNSRMGHVLQ